MFKKYRTGEIVYMVPFVYEIWGEQSQNDFNLTQFGFQLIRGAQCKNNYGNMLDSFTKNHAQQQQ